MENQGEQEVVDRQVDYDARGNKVWCEVCRCYVTKLHSTSIEHWANVVAQQ